MLLNPATEVSLFPATKPHSMTLLLHNNNNHNNDSSGESSPVMLDSLSYFGLNGQHKERLSSAQLLGF